MKSMTKTADLKSVAWAVIAAYEAYDHTDLARAIEDMKRVLDGGHIGDRRDNDPSDR